MTRKGRVADSIIDLIMVIVTLVKVTGLVVVQEVMKVIIISGENMMVIEC